MSAMMKINPTKKTVLNVNTSTMTTMTIVVHLGLENAWSNSPFPMYKLLVFRVFLWSSRCCCVDFWSVALPASWPLRWCPVTHDHPQKVSPGLEDLGHFWHCPWSSIFWTSCRSKVQFCSAFDEIVLPKTCLGKREIRNVFRFLVLCMWYFWLTWYARKSIRSPGVAPGLIEDGVFLSNETSPAKVTTLSSALASILSYTIMASLFYIDTIPNLRFEHVVVHWRSEYNLGLGDFCACTEPFWVHHRRLSSRSYAAGRYKLWYLNGDCSPCFCARGRLQLKDWRESTAPEFLCSVRTGTSCRSCCSIPREIRTQDFTFPGCLDGPCTSITRSSRDRWELLAWDTHPRLHISWLSWRSLHVYHQIFTWSLRVACNLELSNFHRSGNACSEALWISVSRFSVSCCNESLRACDTFFNCSGSKSISSSSSDLLGVSTKFTVSYPLTDAIVDT